MNEVTVVHSVCPQTNPRCRQTLQQAPPGLIDQGNVPQQQMHRFASGACLFAALFNDLDVLAGQLTVNRDEDVRLFLYRASP